MATADSAAPNTLSKAAEVGQSIWLDFIERGLVRSGELARLVDLGLLGVTSNPTIFHSAIESGTGYDEDLQRLARDGKDARGVYEGLALGDIGEAADVLRPVYDRTGGADGFVSIEVNPQLANDTASTIDEARRLSGALDRPNILVKVPATPEGLPAFRKLIGEGISINVTLIFSRHVYRDVAHAYLDGLSDYAQAGNSDLSRVASVASFFVSRIDTLIDGRLPEDSPLRGKAGIANAKIAYTDYQEIFSSEKYTSLAGSGARVQRQLWGSTSVKNPAYPDVLYVDELMGPDTVNTVPPATLDAFLDHGNPAERLTTGVDEAHQLITSLAEVGINIDDVTAELLPAGVKSFTDSFEALIDGIDRKRRELVAA